MRSFLIGIVIYFKVMIIMKNVWFLFIGERIENAWENILMHLINIIWHGSECLIKTKSFGVYENGFL